jgi:hypothetical protein
MQQQESCGKQCCHTVRHQAGSATEMEHVTPSHPNQQENSVFCWVHSEAISLDQPSSVSEVESSWIESSAVGSQLVQLWSCTETGDNQEGHEAVNTEVEGSTALEAITTWLVMTAYWGGLVCAVVNYRVCEFAIALQLLVFKICKCSINPLTNQNPIYSHSYTWQYYLLSSNTCSQIEVHELFRGMSVNFFQTTQHYIAEDSSRHGDCCVNLKSKEKI